MFLHWLKRRWWLIIIIAIIIILVVVGFIKEEKITVQQSVIKEIEQQSQDKEIQAKPQATQEKIIEAIRESLNETTTSSENWSKKITVILNVPFITQAPLGNWSDNRQENGCEETVSIMAMAWVNGQAELKPSEAEQKILDIANWEKKNYGSDADTSAQDTVSRIFKGYWKYNKVEVSTDVSSKNIIDNLLSGRLILVPTNGQLLYNPHYKVPGPTTHMLVVRGYDPTTDEFITNDPGTKFGEKYRYKSKVLLAAVVDYPTGDHLPQDKSGKAMIIVSK